MRYVIFSAPIIWWLFEARQKSESQQGPWKMCGNPAVVKRESDKVTLQIPVFQASECLIQRQNPICSAEESDLVREQIRANRELLFRRRIHNSVVCEYREARPLRNPGKARSLEQPTQDLFTQDFQYLHEVI